MIHCSLPRVIYWKFLQLTLVNKIFKPYISKEVWSVKRFQVSRKSWMTQKNFRQVKITYQTPWYIYIRFKFCIGFWWFPDFLSNSIVDMTSLVPLCLKWKWNVKKGRLLCQKMPITWYWEIITLHMAWQILTDLEPFGSSVSVVLY